MYLLVLIVPVLTAGQMMDGASSVMGISERTIQKIESSISSMDDKIERKTFKTLERLQKQENKLKKELSKKDSQAARLLFKSKVEYNRLADKLKAPTATKKLNEYIPLFDSLKMAFKFLEQSKLLTDKTPKEWKNKVTEANTSIQGLENKLQQANDIKAYIKERRRQIKEQFEKYGLTKKLTKLNKEVYYYQQQLNEYKAMLHDPKKFEQKAIAELRKLPAFTEFMKKNSMLAQLFRIPENYGSTEGLAGLQTRASVQSQIQQRLAGTNINPQQYVGQQMQQATPALNALKDKLNKLGGGSGDIDMPDFKPNTQKTKSFLKRLEYGINVQSQKTNYLLPVTSDLALTVGYKLNDKSVIGLGASYKLGWGIGLQHIKLSHQGMGLRSYVDLKLKGSIWISGGYEQNYQHAFTKIEQLQQFSAWQTSGLIGLTKKYKIAKKTNNLQLLWDFMSYRQVPRRQALLFRIGYVL